jgi:hypothetical protein
MTKQLIAIVTCHDPRYRARAAAQRATWIKDAVGEIDVLFFLGEPPMPGMSRPADEVWLEGIDDGYLGMPAKVQAMFAWARQHGYTNVLKTDDDCYIIVQHLIAAPHIGHPYVGRFRGPSGGFPADYASGYAYWLDTRAMDAVIKASLNEDWAEDRFVANVLAQAGIAGATDDKNYLACFPPVIPEKVFAGPLQLASVFCEYPPHLLHEMYRWHHGTQMRHRSYSQLRAVPLPRGVTYPTKPNDAPPGKAQPPKAGTIILEKKKMDLSRMSILIKTFLRDGYLFDTVADLRVKFPECKLIIMDDGHATAIKDNLYRTLRMQGHVCEYMPFDSGFGAKANAAIPHITTPYVLIGADDFEFGAPDARAGIEKLFTVMDHTPLELGVASGRVDGNAYEGFLSYGPDFIKETPLAMGDWLQAGGVDYKLCDLTVNFSVLRAAMLGFDKVVAGVELKEPAVGCVQWEAAYKIGGEHHDFFQDVKRAGYKVAFVPGVNINQKKYDPRKIAPDYSKYRGRAIECVGKFVLKHCNGVVPEHFYYVGFHGEPCDYVAEAKKRGLL